MNLNRCISSLKMQLGLNQITLPFRDDITGDPVPTENIIKEVLTTTTIPVFSDFQPWIRQLDANVNKLQVVDRLNNIYMLPVGLTTTPIKYVIDVCMPHISNRGTFGDIAPAYGISQSVEGVGTSMAMMMLAGQMRSEPTFEYLGQNKIRLYGFPKVVLTFKVACEHEPNGETIEDSCYESFLELAKLDMKEYLYNNLKMYENIPTAFGNIQLKIEEFQGASGEKESMLKEWRDLFHLDLDVWDYM